MHVTEIETLKQYYKENNGNVNGMKLKVWLKTHTEVKNYLQNQLKLHPNLTCISNIVGCLVNDIDLNSFKCETCGKQLKIRNWTIQKKYCNAKCAMNNPDLQKRKAETISNNPNFWEERQEKIKKTCLERYGTNTPAQNKEIAKKISNTCANDLNHWKNRNEKSKQTCLEKYGVENASSTTEVREKVRQTNFEKYGVDNINKLPETQQKIKQTCLEKYGVNCQFKRTDIIRKTLKKSWQKILAWKDYVIPLFTFDEYTGYNKKQIYKWKCTKCGNEFEQYLYNTKISNLSEVVPRCLKCFPINIGSYKEIDLQNFCAQYFNIEKNNRKLIAPYQLDIVIPQKKVAIQFNGIYWHASQFKDKNYHLNKTLECEKVGYKLIHIWEYDWINPNKQNILKSKIKSILGIDQVPIYARKCQIKQITTKQKNIFLNLHHIQGEDKSKIKLGLFYENQLVAVMTFGKPRFNKNYEYELIRYASKSGYRVLGGAGKLLKYFERNYSPKSLITYANRSYSQGNMYKELGFNLLNISEPSYIWTNLTTVLSRYQCQKSKLKNILKNFNPDLTQSENMSLNGFLKVYDCGNLIFEKIYI